MLTPIVLTLIPPLVGVVGILGLSIFSRLRPYARYVALAAVGLTAVLLLVLRWVGPVEDALFSWHPSALLGITPVLRSDLATQPLALALALATCCAILVVIGRTQGISPRHLAAQLGLLVASVVALWAATPLTMIIGWASYDLLQAAERIAAGGSVRIAVRGLVLGSLATLLLWGGALLSGDGRGSALWELMISNTAQLSVWTVAALLRLWIFPFHCCVPDDFGTAPSLVSLLASPVVGWGLCLRLVQANGGSLPGGGWVLTLAAITLAVGSFLAWACEHPRSMLPWIGMGSTGAILLAAGLAGGAAGGVIAAGCVAWVLGMTALALNDGLYPEMPWWNTPALVGALGVLGVPLTLGFVAESALLAGLTLQTRLSLGVAFFLGNLLLVPSLVRWLLQSSSVALPERRWTLAAYGIGVGLPAALLVVAGFHPPLLVAGSPPSLGGLFSMPGLVGWLLWLTALAGGGVLAWQEKNIRSRIEFLLSVAYDFLRLEWLYGAVVGALNRGLNALRTADEVVRGAGALIWSWVLFLLVLLVWGRL